jgi:hypothetical protein
VAAPRREPRRGYFEGCLEEAAPRRQLEKASFNETASKIPPEGCLRRLPRAGLLKEAATSRLLRGGCLEEVADAAS